MNPELERKLERDIRGIDINDDLIARNKEYQKLDAIYEKYEELLDLIRHTTGIESWEDNEHTKALNKLQRKVLKQMEDITEKVNHDLLFVRLGKCAMIQKSLKES